MEPNQMESAINQDAELFKERFSVAVNENRKGRFKVSALCAQDHNLAALIDAHVLVTSAQRLYNRDVYTVEGFSPLFDTFDGNGGIPIYECIIDIQMPEPQKFKMVRQK